MATAAPRSVFGRMMLRKSVAQIQEETRTSELKRSLGPWNLVFLGIGCIIGAGIFVRTGNAAALACRSGGSDFLCDCRHNLRVRRPVLCRACLDASGLGFGLHLQLCDHRRVCRLGHGRACCCSNMALPRRSSRSAGRDIWSACSATWGCTYPPQLTGPDGPPSAEGRGRRARQRRAGRLRVQPAGFPRLRRARRPAGASAFRNRPSSTM